MKEAPRKSRRPRKQLQAEERRRAKRSRHCRERTRGKKPKAGEKGQRAKRTRGKTNEPGNEGKRTGRSVRFCTTQNTEYAYYKKSKTNRFYKTDHGKVIQVEKKPGGKEHRIVEMATHDSAAGRTRRVVRDLHGRLYIHIDSGDRRRVVDDCNGNYWPVVEDPRRGLYIDIDGVLIQAREQADGSLIPTEDDDELMRKFGSLEMVPQFCTAATGRGLRPR